MYYSVVYEGIIASELDFMTQRRDFEECLLVRAIAMRGVKPVQHNQPTCLPAIVLVTYDGEFSLSGLSVSNHR